MKLHELRILVGNNQPNKNSGVHRVRSIPGLCLTKGPRTAALQLQNLLFNPLGTSQAGAAQLAVVATGDEGPGGAAGGATLFKSPVGWDAPEVNMIYNLPQ